MNQKFMDVLRKRKNPEAVLDLYSRLAVSPVFLEEARPECFGMLLAWSDSRLSAKHYDEWLQRMETTRAGVLASKVMAEDEVDKLFCGIIAKVLQSAHDTQVAVRRLIKAGLGVDSGQILGRAMASGKISPHRLDLIADEVGFI